uniref:Uncharacterized protein n=1 Tax=Oryza sativa subsp. japonica TaxID=39947 RepID=Q6YVB2_ORYSJ|nr:hypothetical protein [Oryza sativa Japonica Group]
MALSVIPSEDRGTAEYWQDLGKGFSVASHEDGGVADTRLDTAETEGASARSDVAPNARGERLVAEELKRLGCGGAMAVPVVEGRGKVAEARVELGGVMPAVAAARRGGGWGSEERWPELVSEWWREGARWGGGSGDGMGKRSGGRGAAPCGGAYGGGYAARRPLGQQWRAAEGCRGLGKVGEMDEGRPGMLFMGSAR